MAYERTQHRKNNDLTKAAIVLSIGLVVSTLVIRNAVLRASSGRYQVPGGAFATKCMLVDTKTGDCFGVIDGEITRFNLRKSNYKANSDVQASALTNIP